MKDKNTKEQDFLFSYMGGYEPISNKVVDKKTSKKYINWGEDNKLPDYIWDSYLNCSNLQAVVNSVVDYTNGSSIDCDFINYGDEDIKSVLSRCIFDLVLFGGFAVECIRSVNNKVSQVKYFNVMNIRIDEELTTAYLSNQWGSFGGKDTKTLPLYDGTNTQPHFIYYYRGAITRNINPVPMWFAAFKSVEVLNEARNYNLNNIRNNFNANMVIALNGTTIKSSELEDIKEKLKGGYSGSDNAGKTLLINNTNSDGKVELLRLDSDKTVDLYKSVQESSIDDIFVAFRINPMLVGINQQTGFNTQEFGDAFALYNTTVILPLQKQVKDVFHKLGIEITINKFNIEWNE